MLCKTGHLFVDSHSLCKQFTLILVLLKKKCILGCKAATMKKAFHSSMLMIIFHTELTLRNI